MKKIAVLFDFSDASKHAVLYAVRLAKKLKVDIEIFNTVSLHHEKLQPELVMIAGHDRKYNKAHSNTPFHTYAKELRMWLQAQNPANDFQVGLWFHDGDLDLSGLMSAILSDRQIIMLITAPFQEKTITEFVLGENFRSLLDWSTIPVLIIPELAPIRNIEKIAFCTSLAVSETDYLNDITKLLEPLSAEVMIAHLNGSENGNSKFLTECEFKAAIAERVDYGRVYYRDIPFKQCGKGWMWLKANKPCDLLVMIQQPVPVFKLFFALEQTAFISYHLPVPLLIMPETH